MRTITASVFGSILVLAASPVWAGQVDPLVDTDWLAAQLGSDDLVVLDIRNRIDGGSAETFAEGHIPGAVYSSYTDAGWRVEREGIVGMLPPVEDLETLVGGLGIDNDDHVVIVPAGVSSTDFGSATRIYWTFKVLGHDAVSILDGGFAAWTKDGAHPVEAGATVPETAVFEANFRPEMIATKDDVAEVIASGEELLIDARPEGQYIGKDKAGPVARAGTLEGAVNLQQQLLVDGAEYTAIDEPSLDALMAEVGIPAEGDQIAFCNTGHWASLAWFAVSEIGGNKETRLYDGSMTEWTADPATEVVVTAN